MTSTTQNHTIRCHDCKQEFDIADRDAIRTHDCTPTCAHCGKAADNIDNPDDLSAQMAVSDHQQACEERPETDPIRDVEGEWREAKREKEHHEANQRKLWKEGVF